MRKISPASEKMSPSRINMKKALHPPGEFEVNQRMRKIIVAGLAKYSILCCLVVREYQCNNAHAMLKYRNNMG
jgi:hypothetical protein